MARPTFLLVCLYLVIEENGFMCFAAESFPPPLQHSVIPEAAIEVPLLAKSGTHHLRLLVGEPPIPQMLIVDTGSHLSSWSCFQKRNLDTWYEPERSATSMRILCEPGCHFIGDSICMEPSNDSRQDKKNRDLSCMLHQRYTEGSGWTAYEVNDLVSLSLSHNEVEDLWDERSLITTIPFSFGCQTSAHGLFQKQYAHGILGLGRSNIQSLPHQLHRHQVTSSNTFSLCLSLSGGIIGFGGSIRRLHTEPLKFTPLVQGNKTSNLYSVQVVEVWLGDACLASESHNPSLLRAFSAGRGTILDSGTTDTYLPSAISSEFETAWYEQTGKSFARRRLYDRSDLANLPDLRLELQGNVTIVVSPPEYMDGASALLGRESENSKLLLHPTIHTTEPRGAVLGINAMIGYDIHFDSHQVGFAKVLSCDDDA